MSIFVEGTREIAPELMGLLVPSDTIRAHTMKVQWQPTEEELAAMIFHAPLPLEETVALLRQYAKEIENAELSEQIQAYTDLYRAADEVFRSVGGPPHIFVLSAAEEPEYEDGTIGYYTVWEKAYQAGCKLGTPFAIDRMPLDTRLQDWVDYTQSSPDSEVSADGASENVPGYLHEEYTADGTVSLAYGAPIMSGLESRASSFGEIFFPVPHPFDRGDIVRVCGMDDLVGVVRETREEMEAFEEAWRREVPPAAFFDYEDIVLTVDLLEENGDFSHAHISPFQLEYIDEEQAPEVNDEQWHLLRTAQLLYKGEGSIETLALLQWPLRQRYGSPNVDPLHEFIWPIHDAEEPKED